MKITVYELLGMIKDGKAPKKIKYKGHIYQYQYNDTREENIINYYYSEEAHVHLIDGCFHDIRLNDEVEILEEEKKIPEKLGYFNLTKDKNEKDENGNNLELHYTGVADTFDDVYEKINEIIDYLDYLKSKGDE